MSKAMRFVRILNQIHAVLLVFIAIIGIMFVLLFATSIGPLLAFIYENASLFGFVFASIFSSFALALGMIQWRGQNNKIWKYVLIWYGSFIIVGYFFVSSIISID